MIAVSYILKLDQVNQVAFPVALIAGEAGSECCNCWMIYILQLKQYDKYHIEPCSSIIGGWYV